MNRLLIVDDEPFIVNGLAAMLTEEGIVDDIEKAMSSFEALEIMKKRKIDILLTDIQMPGMNGLELHEKVRQMWPRCKIVYLTGYNEFSYVQTALRNEGVDYVLKTEGDKAIIAALQRAVELIRSEMEISDYLEKARSQIQEALPLLQHDYLLELLFGEGKAFRHITERFTELQIPLSVESPLLLVVGRIDDWHTYDSSREQALILYAVQNIVIEYLNPAMRLHSIRYKKSHIVWFIQPESMEWDPSIHYTIEAFEQIQTTVFDLLKIPLSVSTATSPVMWQDISRKFDDLYTLLGQSLGSSMMLTDDKAISSGTNSKLLADITGKTKQMIEQLEEYYHTRQLSGFKETLYSILHMPHLNDATEIANPNRASIFYELAGLYINFVYRSGLQEAISREIDMAPLMKYNLDLHWQELVEFFVELTEVLFQVRHQKAHDNENRFVRDVHQYIEDHLSGDLSLNRIAQVFSFNRSYLSRLYIQLTGHSLSETILDRRLGKAKELLRVTQNIVNDISIAIGFESPTYFHRFFKKMTGMTPQEYRDHIND